MHYLLTGQTYKGTSLLAQAPQERFVRWKYACEWAIHRHLQSERAMRELHNRTEILLLSGSRTPLLRSRNTAHYLVATIKVDPGLGLVEVSRVAADERMLVLANWCSAVLGAFQSEAEADNCAQGVIDNFRSRIPPLHSMSGPLAPTTLVADLVA